jgi:hypothetical protein
MSTAVALTTNPGYLKLELSVKGVRLDDTARVHPDIQRLPDVSADIVRGIDLVLPQDVYVNVPLEADPKTDSPFLLAGRGDQLILQRDGAGIEVRVVPQPSFYALFTRSGQPMWHVGAVYGGFIAINPTAGCGYSVRGGPCRFCRSGSKVGSEDGVTPSIEEVIEVVRAAFDEGAVEFVYFNPPYAGSDDAGIAALKPYIAAIKRHFDTLVVVQMHPPRSNEWIDRTYAMGVDAVSYNVEIHDASILARRCAGRARYIGRERYYQALAYAASVFPSGTVWSELVLGLEPADSTIRGIDALVGSGVLPVLSTQRAARSVDLGGDPLPSLEAVTPVLAHLFHAVRQARINMSWVREVCFGITPLEARLFAGDEVRAAGALQHFYRSKLGNLTVRSLSRLRRRLRVRTISDSFDSSQL